MRGYYPVPRYQALAAAVQPRPRPCHQLGLLRTLTAASRGVHCLGCCGYPAAVCLCLKEKDYNDDDVVEKNGDEDGGEKDGSNE